MHKVSRAIVKRKEHSLSFLEYSTYTKWKLHCWGAFKNYCTADYPSFPSFFVTCAFFLRVTSIQTESFFSTSFSLRILFLDWSFSFRLIQFGFWEFNFFPFLLSYPFFFYFWKFSSHCRYSQFLFFDKLVVWPDFIPTIWSHISSNRELKVQRKNPTNNAPCETLFSSVTF